MARDDERDERDDDRRRHGRERSRERRRRSRRAASTSSSSSSSSSGDTRRHRRRRRDREGREDAHEDAHEDDDGAANEEDQVHRLKRLLRHRSKRLEAIRREAERAEREALDAGEALIGPPPPPAAIGPDDAVDHGSHLLAGEGAAMGAFVRDGQRIPRRGEIGLKTEQIERFEQLGYVMSGNRHARMNAVRMRKEAQVYSAEEKAALAALNKEERLAKEQRVLDDMRALVAQQLETNQKS